MTKQVLQQALEALDGGDYRKVDAAIVALRSALAQQGEPVAKYIGECHDGSLVQLYEDLKKGTELYAGAAPAAQHPAAEVIECGNSYAKVKLLGGAFGTTKAGDKFYAAAPAAQPELTACGRMSKS